MPVYDEKRVRRFFESDADDLVANREGRLGHHQRRVRRRTLIFGAVLLGLWIVCMVAAGFAQAARDGSKWVHVGTVIVFAGVIGFVPLKIVLVSLRWLAKDLAIGRITGKVSIGTGEMTVGGQQVKISIPYNGLGGRGPQLQPWVDETLTYYVYTARGWAVNMEPAPSLYNAIRKP